MNSHVHSGKEGIFEVRGARASSVIVQHVPADRVDVFLEWQRQVANVAADFKGYQTTEVYPGNDATQEWVVVIHFDDSKALEDWIASPQRAQWMRKLPADIRDFRLKTLPLGFGAWFMESGSNEPRVPHWKMFLTVLFGLYPTVMLLQMFLSPHLRPLGLAGAMLVGNAASVAFLEWLGMPVISRFLSPWLRTQSTGPTLTGLALLALALAAMTYIFALLCG